MRPRCWRRGANTSSVTMADFTDSLEKIMLGAPRGILLSPADRERTAYHESGHALVGMLTPGADPVRKVSIIPRGMALGVTLSSPDSDRVSYSVDELEAKIKVALGGRGAEEVVYGTVGTGAESDIQQLTQIARQMVGRWGMSEAIGPVAVLPADGQGPWLPGVSETSEHTQRLIDEETQRIVDAAHQDVLRVLSEHRDQLEGLMRALLAQETLDAPEAYAAAGVPLGRGEGRAGARAGRLGRSPAGTAGRCRSGIVGPPTGERGADVRLRDRRCRLGGLRARRATERGPRRAGAAARVRAPGRQREHPRPARLPAARRHRGRLGLPLGPGRALRPPAHHAPARARARRLLVDQRDGLHPRQPARLRRLGRSGLDWADLLPYFIKAEDNERGASQFHGAGGPLPVSEERSHNRISHAFVEAGVQAGLARNADFNGAEQDGVGMYQVTQRGGMRASDRGRLPAPGDRAAEPRGDAVHARAARSCSRARAPSASKPPSSAQPQEFRAEREVILSGWRVQLAAAADALRHRPSRTPDDARNRGPARPAGRRREPRPTTRRRSSCGRRPSPRACCWRSSRPRSRRYEADQTGPFASNLAEAGGFARVGAGAQAPDIQFHAAPLQIIEEGMRDPEAHGVWVSPCLLTEQSRGTVRLASNDPTAKPIIRNEFYSAGRRHGADDRGRAPGARDLPRSRRSSPTAPRPTTSLRATPTRRCARTSRAPRSRSTTRSARAGWATDGQAVVDPELRVNGVEGLRVVDASVMPAVPRGNTNAPTIALAERAADLIRHGRAPAQAAADPAAAPA